MKSFTPASTRAGGTNGSTLLGVLALISVLCFVVLIAFQVMEMSYYGASPSLWPN